MTAKTIETIVIDPAEHAMVLTTTLNRLKAAGACADRYRHLVAKLGGVSFDHDAPINLLTILEHNGAGDCLWALCATAENCDVVARLMAADFAEAVLPIFERERPEDIRPRQAINAARAFALGRIDAAAGNAAGDAARDAAWAAARDAWAAAGAARDAAWDAAWAAARDAGDAAWDAAWAAAGAARDAAWDAAWAAARDAGDAAGNAAWAAAGDAQADIIRRYLKPSEVR